MGPPVDMGELEERLSTPTELAIRTLARLEGDILLLGVGGKMGPTLARMARRALDTAGTSGRRVIGVARFSTPGVEQSLQEHGVETVRADLLDPAQVARLPEAANVILMTGRKFGSSGDQALTWAMNVLVPAAVARRYRGSRLAAFSTGNVYGLSPVARGGSRETDPLEPVGEYAQSAVGRERVLEYVCREQGTPLAILRLNYAVEMRYGVLADVAAKVAAGEPVDVSMGNVNVLWQADANAMALASLGHAAVPPFVVNLAGPEMLSVRRVAEEFGRLLGREVRLTGEESATALLSNGQLGHRLFGYPRVGVQELLEWTADWVKRGGPTLGKPTHFQSRDGRF